VSVHVSSWVWRNTKTLRVGIRMVLVRIADMANDNGEAWPSFGTLAEEVNKSRRQVMNDIAELERLGLLVKTPQEDRSGRSRSNLYRIVMAPEPQGGRVKPTSPSQGEAHFTGRVKPTSPRGCSPLHPPKGEPSREPSNEPTPLTPRAGGDAISPVDVEARLTEVESRLFTDHGVRIARKHLREVRRRLRVGESVEAIVAAYAPPPPVPEWLPPSSDPAAERVWDILRARLKAVSGISAASFATWIYPLAAVALNPIRPRNVGSDENARALELVVAAPTADASEHCARLYSDTLEQAGARDGVTVRFWQPARTEGAAA
jgi:hypothetical protein